MLGKLIKHEWKAVWKVPALLLGILMIIAAVAGLTFALPIWDSDWIGLPMSGIMLIMMFYVAMIGVSLGIVIYLAVRYFKNMFTDEGYLTHTLPVTSRQLLISKVMIMSVWELLSSIGVLFRMVVFGGVAVFSLASKEGDFASLVIEAMKGLGNLWDMPFFKDFQIFGVSTVFMELVSCFSGAMIIIASITMGQMIRKHRVLGSVGAYFAINAVIQGIFMVIMFPMTIKMALDNAFLYRFETSPFSFYTIMFTIMSVVYLAVGVGLYFLSEYLLHKQLELE